MPLAFRSQKLRRRFSAGLFLLSLGLILRDALAGAGVLSPVWIELLRGLAMGVGTGLVLGSVYLARRGEPGSRARCGKGNL
jgi:hypothetical protein